MPRRKGDGKKKEKSQRSSGRAVVLTKALRTVDEETRKIEEDNKLESLEADNYNEGGDGQADDSDDAFDMAEDSDEERTKRKKKRKAMTKKSHLTSGRGVKWINQKIKPLRDILWQEGHESTPNYTTIAAGPSIFPRRYFCGLCGNWGTAQCSRLCGARVCGRSCNNKHKENKCMKVGTGLE